LGSRQLAVGVQRMRLQVEPRRAHARKGTNSLGG
jgi:hypothetical protein